MRLSSLLKTSKKPKAKQIKLDDGKIFTVPSPTGGWNARDPLNGMAINDAVILDNFFPTTADVRLRSGHSVHATGLSTFVETLITYKSGSATRKMFAATAAGNIYDASAAGAVGAAVVSGMTNGRWQWTNFTTSGGAFLVLVNGADTPRQYDGTSWIASTMTGLTTANLIHVFEFKRRLFFIEKDKLKLWYLAVDAITGALTAFDVSAQFKKGGYLMAGGSLTRDGGDGMDDMFVVISSEGEVLIYQGLDPGTDFVKVGLYDIGSPIGRRCLIKTGADLAAITIDGVVGISQIITLDRAASNKVSLSDKIRDAFNTAAQSSKDKFGWQALTYPFKNMVLFNVPITERSEQHQYVMNSVTGSFCRFKGWNAGCWVLFNERIYFGGNDGKVYKADDGLSDNGSVIQATMQTAFSYPYDDPRYKHFKSMQVIIKTESQLVYGIAYATDFATEYILNYTNYDPGSDASFWDVATWDVDPWSTFVLTRRWHDIPARGAAVAVVFSVSVKGTEVQINAFNGLFEPGEMT